MECQPQRTSKPALIMPSWLFTTLLLGGADLGGGFQLQCYTGRGAQQPAFRSDGSQAMVFPNSPWTQSWLDDYLAVHPELKTFDVFGFETGYSVGADRDGDGDGDGFDFGGGEPPDDKLFRELVITDTGIPPTSVRILSRQQTVLWKLRLPGQPSHYAPLVGTSAAARAVVELLTPPIAEASRPAFLASAYAAFAVVASPYVVQGVGGAAQFAVEANLTLRVDSSQGDVWALVKQVGFIDGVLDRITNTSGVAFVPQPGATYLAVPGTTIGNPTAQELPLLVDVSVFTAVEYAVDSLRTCNSSSAIVDQFNRYDYNSDNRLSAHETAGMLYEMGRTGAPGAVMAVAKVAVLMTPFDSNFDNHLSKVEISRIDPHRAVLLDKTRDQLVADTGWRVSGTVTAAGTGLVNVSAALITAAAVGECLVIQDALLVKICLVTEIVGFPQVAPDEARCVRKNSRDMFNNTQVEYQCAGWDICGEVPDPAFSGEVAQPNLKYDCDFGACVPDTLIHGDGLVVNPVSDFRCWDTCRLVTNMSQCPHIEQRPHYCRHGSQCFFVDTLDNSVMSDDGLATKLHNLSRMVDEYAGACDVDYGGIGYREECRWMRCHAMGNALGQACDNKVVPPCRSVCEAYLQTGALGNIPGVLQNCTDPTPDSIQLSNSIVWTLNHCDALKRLNCSVFPADDPHLAAGQCQVPTRYLGGIPCVRDGECISNDCPPHEDAPNTKARGICCNADLNSCSGHGVCVSRTGLFSPNSLGPDIAVPVGGCICEVNWTGPDCSQWVMPLEMFFVLSGVSFVVTLGTAFHVKRWLRWWNWVHAAPDPTPPPSPLPPPQKPPHDSSSDDGDADVLDIAEHILDAHEQGEAEKRVDDVLVAAQDALVAPNVPGNDIQETRHAEQVA